MAPLVRRTWAPRGQTPVLYQRTRSHKKVSVIAALCVSPTKDHVQMFFRLHPNANIDATYAADFLKNLSRQLQGPIVLIWDRLQAHRKANNLVRDSYPIHSFFLPPYAPELNPVENVWSYLKMNPMANRAHMDVDDLVHTARHHGRSVQRKPPLLLAFLKHSPLSLRIH